MMTTSWRTWAGRIALIAVPPLALLLSLDLACRAFGWGYPTSFLVPDEVNGREVWRTNEFYGYRFFQPLMARSPAPIAIDREKPAGIKRVAVLGESAAMGDPLIEFSLARALDKILNAPGETQRYEVINAAMTAISSPVIVDIAEELSKKDVDIFVVYMGNNEVVGPYGPDTEFRRGVMGQWFTPWHVRWTRTRLASAVQSWLATSSPGKPWDGMAMFAENRLAATDPKIDGVYKSYEQNLERIVAIAEKHGIETILCTMAVNLRDCPPFGSAHGAKITEENMKKFLSSLDAGQNALERENFAEARILFAEALRIDANHAQTNYLMAIAAEKSGDAEEAALYYRRARDLDTLRVRTDSRMNELICAVAGRSGTKLIESDEVFGPAPGAESFVDHVHFTLEGVGLLASAVAAAIEQNTAKLNTETLADRLDYNDWSRSKLATIMLQRLENPPFVDQAGNAERMERWRGQQEALRAKAGSSDGEKILADLSTRQASYPRDNEYAVQSLHRLAGVGAWTQAAELADSIRPSLYGSSPVNGLLALVYAKTGRPEDAAAVLTMTGPPFGYFLVDATFQLLGALAEMGEINTARTVADGILKRAPSFPGRVALARWREQAGM